MSCKMRQLYSQGTTSTVVPSVSHSVSQPRVILGLKLRLGRSFVWAGLGLFKGGVETTDNCLSEVCQWVALRKSCRSENVSACI